MAGLISYLAFEVFKKEILKAVMTEFLRRGLDKLYAEEIKAWKVYLDQKKFAVKLDKQMKAEIERFTKDIQKYSVPELKEIVIEGLNCPK